MTRIGDKPDGNNADRFHSHRYKASHVQSIQSFDTFTDATKGDNLLPAGTEDTIHIRIQQRNGRKALIIVQETADDYDKKKLETAFKKKFACSGTVIEYPEYGEVIQVTEENKFQFLLEINIFEGRTVEGPWHLK
ncbi:hypothetical protein AMELA_G00078680 [Ameiurus melas]|uniref:SUI1 domain-containing protein n=1 Tax=Ameiurus melas TaxID=219545 RepID=A0A7J6B120_AMEME|nr:hypothetical protein AMELA_G00078680 [Ameiurus melas]